MNLKNIPTVKIGDRVARLNDIPYWSTKTMQFTFSQSASLVGGTYPFLGDRAVMTGAANFTGSTLILIRNISFAADIPVLDYQQSLQLLAGGVDVPTFHVFSASNANAPLFRNPILLYDYFQEQDYVLAHDPRREDDQYNAFFRGTLQQTAALAGITNINLLITIYADEINDNKFISQFKKQYPLIN